MVKPPTETIIAIVVIIIFVLWIWSKITHKPVKDILSSLFSSND